MMRFLFFIILLSAIQKTSASAIELSQQLLANCKMGRSVDLEQEKLEKLALSDLQAELISDQKKLAFWINIYNATTQISLRKHPEYFKSRKTFYKKKLVTIAGIPLSLDEIEHGILRRNRAKLSWGYWGKLRTKRHIKDFMVEKIDPRIHFALNCGAKSCPPVLNFSAEKIDEELNLSTAGYLEVECEKLESTIAIPKLFSWFRGDFGGKKGIIAFLVQFGIAKQGELRKITYKPYNWELTLSNYN